MAAISVTGAAGAWRLNSVDEALAVSCNIYFADLGLHLGRERLERFMRSAGFDGQVNLGIFQVPLGSPWRLFNNFETAFFAIGLEHEEINAIHSRCWRRWSRTADVDDAALIRQRRSILGEIVTTVRSRGRRG